MKSIFLFIFVIMSSVAAALSYSEREGVLKRNPSLDKADYLGYSHGCRVALDSLSEHGSGGYSNNWKIENNNGTLNTDTSLPDNPIDTFIGAQCIGAFNGLTKDDNFGWALKSDGKQAIDKLKIRGKIHINRGDLFKKSPNVLFKLVGLVFPGNDVSVNVMSYYVDLTKTNTDTQPGIGVNINQYIQIDAKTSGKPDLNKGDLLVTSVDQTAIYNNINASGKRRFVYEGFHGFLPQKRDVLKLIRKTLNNESLTQKEKMQYFLEES